MLEIFWLWKDHSTGVAGVLQRRCSACIMRAGRGCAGTGAGTGSNPGCGVRLWQPPLACQHPLGASLLKGAVRSLGSDCHLLPVNSWSSPSLLYKVCHICPVAGSRTKIPAVSFKLGRMVPAAGMWPGFFALSTPQGLGQQKASPLALMGAWLQC